MHCLRNMPGAETNGRRIQDAPVVDRDAVLFMQLASRDHTETEEEGETKCKIQNRESPRVSGLLV